MHFGDGERLFYGKVQDAAVPIRQALAVTEDPDSPHGPLDSPPLSPRELNCCLSLDLQRLGYAFVLQLP